MMKPKKAAIPVDRLTREYFQRSGYLIHKVERFNHHIKRRIDLFGFADYLAFHPDKRGVIAIQTTSAPNKAAHRSKILAERRARLWASSPDRWILLLAWAHDLEWGGFKLDRERLDLAAFEAFAAEIAGKAENPAGGPESPPAEPEADQAG